MTDSERKKTAMENLLEEMLTMPDDYKVVAKPSHTEKVTMFVELFNKLREDLPRTISDQEILHLAMSLFMY